MNIRQLIQTKSMKTIMGLFFLALLFGASDARAQCDGPKRVAFQRGLTTAVLKGAIPASKAICYQLRARGGQKMIVHLAAPARAVLFTVIPDGYDVEPLAQDVASWEGVLDATGDYTAPCAGTFLPAGGQSRAARARSDSRSILTGGASPAASALAEIRRTQASGMVIASEAMISNSFRGLTFFRTQRRHSR